MEYKIIVKHGQLYNKETNERIVMSEGVEMILIADKKHVKSPPKDYQESILDAEELLTRLIKDPKVLAYARVLQSNNLLYFKIRSLVEENEYLFTLRLLENL